MFFVQTNIIGTGTKSDPYRPDIPASVPYWSANIPVGANGVPLNTRCNVFVRLPNNVVPVGTTKVAGWDAVITA